MAKMKDFIVRTRIDNTDERYAILNSKFDTNDYVYLDAFALPEGKIVFASDYAVMNGAFLDHEYYDTFKKRMPTWRWLRYAEEKDRMQYVCAEGQYVMGQWRKDSGLCPEIHLDVMDILANKKLIKHLNIQPVIDHNGATIYHTLQFGSYPQDRAIISDYLEAMYKANKLTPTGKTYTGWMSITDRFEQNREFECDGKKYVRVISNYYNSSAQFKDGEKVPETGNPIWAEVQPIKWKILNFGNLPKELNPEGNETATKIHIRTEDAILSGIPFFPERGNAECTMWQNSPIRAYFNGYNLHEEIDAGNGNKEYKTDINYDFKGHGFLDEIGWDKVFLKENSSVDNLQAPNPYDLVYDDVDNEDLLMMYIQSGTSVFLHGPSGVGKSSRVKQIDPTATRITLRPQMNPEEIDGTLDRETGNYIPPLWYTQLCEKCKAEPDRKHVLFIDELTNVKPTVQSLVYSIVLDHAGKDGLWPLPDNAVVVAAGNETADSSVANNLPGALHRRFCHIYYQIDKQAWLDWAMGVSKVKKQKYEPSKKEDRAKIHPAILTYIMSRGDDILNQDLDEENPKIVTDPRKWEIASNVLYETKNPNALVPAIGEDLTADFTFFVQSIPVSVKDVINGEYSKRDFAEMAIDRKMSTILGLLPAKEEQLTPVRAFIQDNLGKELLATYDSLWIRNNPERAQIIAENSLDAKAEIIDTTQF